MFSRNWIFISLMLASTTVLAAPRHRESHSWVPDTMFAQAGGAADESTSAYALGANWNWNRGRRLGRGYITGYTEASIGSWRTDAAARGGARNYSQFGVTEVLRYFPGDGPHLWFAEIGVGANYITPVYQGEGKSFSTEFNFGDHLAVGRILGQQRLGSVALRLQHFSNGGIDAPNPGENFLQLRYTYQFKFRSR